MIRKAMLVGFTFIGVSLCHAQVSVGLLNLPNGEYGVSFDHYVAYDSSRSYNRIFNWTNKSIIRPISVSIWYPSKQDVSEIEPLRVQDYLSILKEEEEWEHLPDEQILNWFQYPNTPQNRDHINNSTSSYLKLEASAGRFPVIIYAPSYQASSIENFALCELLASHGYVVISSPSRGTENRFFEGGTLKDLETQARDVEFLYGEMSKYVFADLTQTAVVGFSFGGMSSVLAQVRNESIKAIVSLDGTIKYGYETITQSPYFNIDRVDVPFIHFSQKEIPNEVLVEDNIDPSLNTVFTFYDSVRYSEAYHFQFHHLTHSYFSSLGVLFETRDKRQDKSDVEIMSSYRLMSSYTLNFLDAYLKGSTRAKEVLIAEVDVESSDNGLTSKTVKAPEKRDFDLRSYHDLVASRNYMNLLETYDSLHAVFPSLELPEGSLNNLGLQLVFHPTKSKFGIRVLLLATTLYPNSANLWDSLAEGYLYVGDKENALQSFERSLMLDPQNGNALKRLKELER